MPTRLHLCGHFCIPKIAAVRLSIGRSDGARKPAILLGTP